MAAICNHLCSCRNCLAGPRQPQTKAVSPRCGGHASSAGHISPLINMVMGVALGGENPRRLPTPVPLIAASKGAPKLNFTRAKQSLQSKNPIIVTTSSPCLRLPYSFPATELAQSAVPSGAGGIKAWLDGSYFYVYIPEVSFN